MLKRATIALLTCAALILVAAWESSLIPHYVKDCSYNYETGQQECTFNNILLLALGQIPKSLDVISALITAVATGVIAWFTRTIWLINRSQLTHSHQVERAYISVSGFPDVETLNLGTQTVPGTTGGVATIDLGARRTPTGNFQITLTNNGKTPGETLPTRVRFL